MAVEPEESVSSVHQVYKNKQIEFTKWCDDKGSSFGNLTRYAVTGPKLHLLLVECVIGRSKCRKNKEGRE
ncbi:hypothetical protein GN244_ATG14228 [Phytophthora infestans]|uniref:Uncharacterized protein n=1 Tax=Phytophthora infestans TaxID=4787 RepID=A0A833WQE4_PHYIN|nr:hypothetical protein GN244_ATG20009 [Phytophthora infestans]KAF4033816.1 hypothetical protein GN244_ATG14228 [Phytophthora infestans]